MTLVHVPYDTRYEPTGPIPTKPRDETKQPENGEQPVSQSENGEQPVSGALRRYHAHAGTPGSPGWDGRSTGADARMPDAAVPNAACALRPNQVRSEAIRTHRADPHAPAHTHTHRSREQGQSTGDAKEAGRGADSRRAGRRTDGRTDRRQSGDGVNRRRMQVVGPRTKTRTARPIPERHTPRPRPSRTSTLQLIAPTDRRGRRIRRRKAQPSQPTGRNGTSILPNRPRTGREDPDHGRRPTRRFPRCRRLTKLLNPRNAKVRWCRPVAGRVGRLPSAGQSLPGTTRLVYCAVSALFLTCSVSDTTGPEAGAGYGLASIEQPVSTHDILGSPPRQSHRPHTGARCWSYPGWPFTRVRSASRAPYWPAHAVDHSRVPPRIVGPVPRPNRRLSTRGGDSMAPRSQRPSRHRDRWNPPIPRRAHHVPNPQSTVGGLVHPTAEGVYDRIVIK